MNFTNDEIHRSFVFVTQGFVRNGDEKSLAAMLLVTTAKGRKGWVNTTNSRSKRIERYGTPQAAHTLNTIIT